ncbi:hypothetical protein GCM10009760_26160 [Kitasatospora kazusensis]|uniref:Holin n=2 Tax=Kitasatospora kazusensis TaxID=407974 RepID=A0ABN2ZG54_9ACTN
MKTLLSRAFARDVIVLFSSASIAALSPLLATTGVLQISGGQWLGAADHVLTAVVLGVLALAGTPLSRAYGVGTGPQPVLEPPVPSAPPVTVPVPAAEPVAP